MQGGGAERVLSDMANYWARRNWRITLATWSGPETEDFYAIDPAVRRVWLDVRSADISILKKIRSNLMLVRNLRRLIRDVNPDAVLSFIDRSNVQTIVATIGLDVRVVISERVNPEHNPTLSWPWRALRRLLYAQAQIVVAQTEDVAAWLDEKCKANTITIPNPLREMPMLSTKREPLILAVGRLNHQKGIDLLLRAFAEIHERFDQWRVMIVGAGPEKCTLTDLRNELALSAKVHFVDPDKNIELLMSRAGLVVQPSRFEGFPNVILEAMGMGAAVVSTDCPSGPSEIIQDGFNGRLVPVDDVDALVKVMIELMSDPDTRRRIGENAKLVRRRYRQESIMEIWESCLVPQCNGARSSESANLGVTIERQG